MKYIKITTFLKEIFYINMGQLSHIEVKKSLDYPEKDMLHLIDLRAYEIVACYPEDNPELMSYLLEQET